MRKLPLKAGAEGAAEATFSMKVLIRARKNDFMAKESTRQLLAIEEVHAIVGEHEGAKGAAGIWIDFMPVVDFVGAIAVCLPQWQSFVYSLVIVGG
jgi:hypothetical protein